MQDEYLLQLFSRLRTFILQILYRAGAFACTCKYTYRPPSQPSYTAITFSFKVANNSRKNVTNVSFHITKLPKESKLPGKSKQAQVTDSWKTAECRNKYAVEGSSEDKGIFCNKGNGFA